MPKFGLYGNSDYFLKQPSEKYFGGTHKSIFRSGKGLLTSTDHLKPFALRKSALLAKLDRNKVSKTEISHDYTAVFTGDDRLDRSDTLLISEDHHNNPPNYQHKSRQNIERRATDSSRAQLGGVFSPRPNRPSLDWTTPEAMTTPNHMVSTQRQHLQPLLSPQRHQKWPQNPNNQQKHANKSSWTNRSNNRETRRDSEAAGATTDRRTDEGVTRLLRGLEIKQQSSFSRGYLNLQKKEESEIIDRLNKVFKDSEQNKMSSNLGMIAREFGKIDSSPTASKKAMSRLPRGLSIGNIKDSSASKSTSRLPDEFLTNKLGKEDRLSPSRSKGGSPEVSVLIQPRKDHNTATIRVLEDSMDKSKNTDQTKRNLSRDTKENGKTCLVFKPSRQTV